MNVWVCREVCGPRRKGFTNPSLGAGAGGQIVAEAYASGPPPDPPLLGWSQGKSLTSIMLGWLKLRGQISVAEQQLFPLWANDSRSEISIENLLQMSSGLDFAEVYAPGSDATRMLFMDPVASA